MHKYILLIIAITPLQCTLAMDMDKEKIGRSLTHDPIYFGTLEQNNQKRTLYMQQEADWIEMLKHNINNTPNLICVLNSAANVGIVLHDKINAFFNQDLLKKSIKEPSPNLLKALLRHKPTILEAHIEEVIDLHKTSDDYYYLILLELLHKAQKENDCNNKK